MNNYPPDHDQNIDDPQEINEEDAQALQDLQENDEYNYNYTQKFQIDTSNINIISKGTLE